MDIKDFNLFAETFAKAITLGSVEELTDEQAGAFIFDDEEKDAMRAEDGMIRQINFSFGSYLLAVFTIKGTYYLAMDTSLAPLADKVLSFRADHDKKDI